VAVFAHVASTAALRRFYVFLVSLYCIIESTYRAAKRSLGRCLGHYFPMLVYYKQSFKTCIFMALVPWWVGILTRKGEFVFVDAGNVDCTFLPWMCNDSLKM
jgi:hypothetical protein